MSLKIVHVCFILSAAVMMAGFGFWGVRDASGSGSGIHFWLGAGSFPVAGALVVYLFWFLSKMKKAPLS